MTQVYQASDGKWIVLNNDQKTYFLSNQEQEARIMADKIKFTNQVCTWSTNLAVLFKNARDLQGVYFDEGFDGAGSDPITDVDVTSLGVTATDVSSVVTLLQQLQNLENNIAVITGDYGSIVNRMRTDL